MSGEAWRRGRSEALRDWMAPGVLVTAMAREIRASGEGQIHSSRPIARAIIHEPSILLADEPTGNLDPEAAREIIQVLRSLQRRGMTVVVGTHDRNLTAEFQERIVLLNKGFLIEDDGSEDAGRHEGQVVV